MKAKTKLIVGIVAAILVAVIGITVTLVVTGINEGRQQHIVRTATDLTTAMSRDTDGKDIILADNITVDGDVSMTYLNSIDLNGYTLTVNGDFTIESEQTKDISVYSSSEQNGTIVADTVTIEAGNAHLEWSANVQIRENLLSVHVSPTTFIFKGTFLKENGETNTSPELQVEGGTVQIDSAIENVAYKITVPATAATAVKLVANVPVGSAVGVTTGKSIDVSGTMAIATAEGATNVSIKADANSTLAVSGTIASIDAASSAVAIAANTTVTEVKAASVNNSGTVGTVDATAAVVNNGTVTGELKAATVENSATATVEGKVTATQSVVNSGTLKSEVQAATVENKAAAVIEGKVTATGDVVNNGSTKEIETQGKVENTGTVDGEVKAATVENSATATVEGKVTATSSVVNSGTLKSEVQAATVENKAAAVIEGKVTATGDVVNNGSTKEIETQGKVENTGTVDGEVKAATVENSATATVEGKVTATESVVNSGTLKSEVQAATVENKAAAVIEGKVTATGDVVNNGSTKEIETQGKLENSGTVEGVVQAATVDIKENAQITGDIKATGEVTNAGKVDGNIETEAQVVISSTAEVTGDVRGSEVQAEAGTIAGDTHITTKDDQTLTVTLASFTYGEAMPQYQVVGTPATQDEPTIRYKKAGEPESAFNAVEAATAPTAAGSYVMSIRFAGTENVNPYRALVEFTISKAQVTLPTDAYTLTYNAAEQAYRDATNDIYTVAGTIVATNVGTYNVTYTLKDTANYEWSDGTIADITRSWSIERAAITVTVTIEGWTYGETAKTAQTSGNLGEADVTYRYFTSEEVELEGVPTNAGSYKVQAIVAESANYRGGVSALVDFTIAKAANNATVTIEGWAYGGTPNAPVIVSQSTGAYVVEYKLAGAEDDTYTTDVPTAIGVYVVRVTIAADNNYLAATCTTDLELGVAKIDAPAAITTVFTYNGQAQTYALTENTLYEITGNVQTDAGTYTVTVALTESAKLTHRWSDTNDTADKTYTWTINRASMTLGLTMAGWTYGGTASEPQLTGNVGGGTTTYEYFTTESIGSDRPTNAGSYRVVVTVPQTQNYLAATADATFTISKAQMNLALSLEGWTYGSTANNPVLTGAMESAAVTYTYKVSTADDSTYVATAPENAGTYTIRATVADTANYLGGVATATYTIAKATVTAPAYTAPTLTYTGAVLGVETSNFTDFNGEYYDLVCLSKTDAGEGYKAYLQLKDKTNYIWSDTSDTEDKEYTWSIAQATLTLELNITGWVESKYDVETNAPVLTGYTGTNVEYTYYVNSVAEDNKIDTFNPAEREMGTYYVTATVTDPNYVTTTTTGTSFTITVNPEAVRTAAGLRAALADTNITNIVIAANLEYNLVIDRELTLTILGNYTLTNANNTHTIINKSTLTILGSGTIDNKSHQCAALQNAYGATVIIGSGTDMPHFTRVNENGKSSTDSGANSYYYIQNFGTMTIINAYAHSNGAFSSLIANGWQSARVAQTYENAATLTIENGDFYGGINTVKNDENSTLFINGGKFLNSQQHAVLNYNLATISGGEFEATVREPFYNANSATTSIGRLTITVDNLSVTTSTGINDIGYRIYNTSIDMPTLTLPSESTYTVTGYANANTLQYILNLGFDKVVILDEVDTANDGLIAINSPVVINSGKTTTLDLQNKKIIMGESFTGGQVGIRLEKGTLTIMNGSIDANNAPEKFVPVAVMNKTESTLQKLTLHNMIIDVNTNEESAVFSWDGEIIIDGGGAYRNNATGDYNYLAGEDPLIFNIYNESKLAGVSITVHEVDEMIGRNPMLGDDALGGNFVSDTATLKAEVSEDGTKIVRYYTIGEDTHLSFFRERKTSSDPYRVIAFPDAFPNNNYRGFVYALTHGYEVRFTNDITIPAAEMNAILETENVTDFIIDLDGKKLTIIDTAGTPDTTVKIPEGKTLKIFDTKEPIANTLATAENLANAGTLYLSNVVETGTAMIAYSNAKLILDNINIVSSGIVAAGEGTDAARKTIEVNYCYIKLTEDGYKGFATNAYTDSNVYLTLNYTTLDATASIYGIGIEFNTLGELKIENSKIIGRLQAVLLRAGKATITDSHLEQTDDDEHNRQAGWVDPENWTSGNCVALAALVVGSNAKGVEYDTDGNVVGGYKYPANVTLTNSTVKGSGKAYTFAIYESHNSSLEATLTATDVTVDGEWYVTVKTAAELISAMGNAEIENIKLAKSIATTVQVMNTAFSSKTARELNIDLNGNDLTLTTNTGAITADNCLDPDKSLGNAIMVYADQTLNIYDSTVSLTGRSTAANMEDAGTLYLHNTTGGMAAICVWSNGGLTLENINVSAYGVIARGYDGGLTESYDKVIEFTNCYITTSGNKIVATNASQDSLVYITVTNSTLDVTTSKYGIGIEYNVSGKLVVENSSITGRLQAILVRAGEAEITDSHLEQTEPNYVNAEKWSTPSNWSSGNCVAIAALVVGCNATTSYPLAAKVTMTGTDVVASDGTYTYAIYVSYAHEANGYDVIFNTTGGTVTGKTAVWTEDGELIANVKTAAELLSAAANTKVNNLVLTANIEDLDGKQFKDIFAVNEVATAVTTVNINLNGYNLTLTTTGVGIVENSTDLKTYKNGDCIVLYEGQTLNFYDTKETGRGTLYLHNATYAASSLMPKKGATLKLTNIDVKGWGTVALPDGDAALVRIENSNVYTSGAYVVGTNSLKPADSAGVQIEIINSILEVNSPDDDSCVVMLNVDGTLTIENSTIKAEIIGVYVRAGKATITNSEITTTVADAYDSAQAYSTPDSWGGGNNTARAALVVGNNAKSTISYLGNVEVTVEDTTITGVNSEYSYAIYLSHRSTLYTASLTLDSDCEVTGKQVVYTVAGGLQEAATKSAMVYTSSQLIAAAADNDIRKIVLAKDITTTAATANAARIKIFSDKVIDLNGYNITTDKADQIFRLQASDINVVIENSKAATKISTVTGIDMSYGFSLTYSGMTLTVKAGVNTVSACLVEANAEGSPNTLNLYGQITGNGNDVAILTNGASGINTVINIYEGAVVTSDGVAIYLPGGTLNVYGGTITGSTAIYAKNATLNIEAGTIIANGTKSDYVFNKNGCYSTGDAVVVEYCYYNNNFVPVINITGGTFVSENAAAVASYAYTGDDVERTPVTGFIKGGNFSSELGELVFDGYTATANEDGTWTVNYAESNDGDMQEAA